MVLRIASAGQVFLTTVAIRATMRAVMSDLFPDTRPEAVEVQVAMLRQLPAWRKLEMVGQLNQMVQTLALSGLRQWRTEATPEELHRLLADLLLGPELAARAYGSPSGKE
jgi:hypothetical protein